YHRLATFGLHGDHLGPLARYPTKGFHFAERFPHADETDAATRGIEDRIRHGPAELFGQFIAHGLFAFDAVGLFERADIKPALGIFALGDDSAAIADQTVHQGDVRP